MTTTTDLIKITPRTATTQNYQRLAFCSAITPATSEHYSHLREAGIDTASICLGLSGYNHYKFSVIHTNLARQAGMTTHAFYVTDLNEITDDLYQLSNRFCKLGYSAQSKITIWVTSNRYIKDKEERINELIDLISRWHNRELIDVAFYKRDIDAGMYNLSKLPKMINLTIINCNALSAGIVEAGTWIYTTNMGDDTQVLAYDYYGYYTDHSGYQLSLVDTDYIVQKGDTWLSIARRHGIPVNDLISLNRAADIAENLFEGQVVRIA